MFPQTNKISRLKEPNSISSFKLSPEKAPLLQDAGIVIQNTNKNMKSSYFMTCKTTEKLYVIDTHFSKTYTHTNTWVENN